jgi:glucose/arabinose dehydrogenase/mono/diheme cytochrome c family protein
MPTSFRLRGLVASAITAALVVAWAERHPRAGQAPVATVPSSAQWGPWLEPDAPFFSSVVDGRRAGGALPADNLAPRALVLRAGDRLWAAFDPDLLRVVAVWRGDGVTPTALAPGSYRAPDRKTPAGQTDLPVPDGPVWLANGLYPGWQVGERPSFEDPREPAPSPEEVGRGPIAETLGRFTAIRPVPDGVVLEYDVAGAAVKEWVTGTSPASSTAPGLVRHFELGPATQVQWLMVGVAAAGTNVAIGADRDLRPVLESVARPGGGAVQVVRVPPHAGPARLAVAIAPGRVGGVTPAPIPTGLAPPRWRAEVTTRVKPSASTDAYVVDDVPLPLENPWRRNLRVGDVQFLADGTGVLVTIDGDVWLARDLAAPAGVVRWKRFASGLHEPLTAAVRDDEIHVFDRNGVWRLRDVDGDGEADRHELFSNAFAQTADSREFPSTIRLGPGGEFVIAKGGQEATTIGKHNGSVLRLSADGRQATVLGYGLRQPQLAVHPATGLVTASDQQGHYIPSTPLHVVKGRQFYGFLSDKLPREIYPAAIAAPLTWIPHSVNASGMSQVWLTGARLGPLDDGLVHIGYNRPELFRVLLDLARPMPQAAVVSLTTAFDHPPLNGAVNPADGQLYIAGFQIIGWGTTATRQAGLSRVRFTGAPVTVPRQITPMREGVLLRFDVAVDPSVAADASRYTAASWQYRRTFRYGSPNFKADGTPGVDPLAPSRAYVSSDGRAVFVAIAGMRPVMQLEVGWSIASRDGLRLNGKGYTTPYALERFDPRAEGFGDIVLDLTQRAPAPAVPATAPVVSVEEGRRLFVQYGCLACHATERGGPDKLGPPLVGVFGATRRLSEGKPPTVADEAYLRQSIREPAAAVLEGYDKGGTGMPSFAGVLTDAQIASVVEFIKGLTPPP